MQATMIPVFMEVPRVEKPQGWKPVPPVDKYEMGYWLRQARRFAGNKPQQAISAQALSMFGAQISASTISNWEDGKHLPSQDGFDVLRAIYSPPGGMDWFAPAYCPALREALGMQLLPNVKDPWV